MVEYPNACMTKNNHQRHEHTENVLCLWVSSSVAHEQGEADLNFHLSSFRQVIPDVNNSTLQSIF